MITWYKGDRIVSAGSLQILNEPRFDVRTASDGSVALAIRNVRMGDEDDYVCEVNLKDAPISIKHHLEVLGEWPISVQQHPMRSTVWPHVQELQLNKWLET